MPVETGTRLGVYEVLGPLGAGGMGEVYRARDPRLGRDVAIKVLPAAFSNDAGRLARFEQEARAAAGLNHPNILAVYDIGQLPSTHSTSSGPTVSGVEPSTGSGQAVPYIVSELLEGSTLRDLTPAAALPVRKAIDYGAQIAKGLAAAHDKGIVHRDLKPENLFVTTDGRVKILDFGLAKLTEKEPTSTDASDVATKANTDPGLVLGTVGYMAPEQVRGLPADHRSDIFALGCVLYEMLSGQRAFRRDTSMDTMTAILKEDPPDLPLAERHIPPALARVIDRCLEKAPGARFQSTGDLAFALEALSSHTDSLAAITDAPEPRKRDRLAWTLVTVLAVVVVIGFGLGAALYFGRAPAATDATRFFVSPPDGWALAVQVQGATTVGPLAVSPDGRQVAFVARNAAGQTVIWLRSLDTLNAKGLAGTEGGSSPFWSPDGRSLGFFSGGKLQKIDIAGGPPVTLCDASPGISGTWSPSGVIVFSPAAGTSLQKVSSSGGIPTPATVLGNGEAGHARPAFLPDGRHFLYRVTGGTFSPRGPAFAASLDSPERTRLVDVDSTNVLYSRRHLLYLRETTLVAVQFDPDRLATEGEPFPVAEQIQTFGTPSFGFFSASDSGVLAYQSGSATRAPRLTWLDRSGKKGTTVGDPATYADLAMSRDGRKAAVSFGFDVWVLDLDRNGLRTRLTFDPSADYAPIWSPDGSQIAFSSTRSGSQDIYLKQSSGAGNEQVLVAGERNQAPIDWSRDGRFLLYVSNSSGLFDLWVLPLTGDRKPFPYLNTPANEALAEFSPDGRWIAYQSNESGRDEVYVAAFDGSHGATGGKWQISSGGGIGPRWNQDGREIFYVSPPPDNTLMAASVSGAESTFHVGTVERLFTLRPDDSPRYQYEYKPSPDGKRFLVNVGPAVEATPTPITVVLNWTAGIRK